MRDDRYWLYGKHAVVSALANSKRKKYKLLIDENTSKSTHSIPEGLQTEYVCREDISRELGLGAIHQGVALVVSPLPTPNLEQILMEKNDHSILVVLDQVTDPRNVGAIIRSAAALKASAIILTEKHSPIFNGTVEKAAAGAADTIPAVRVKNLVRALKMFKEYGYWVYGLDINAKETIEETSLSNKLVLILGSEERGLRELTVRNCDKLVKIPIQSTVESLNVSVAISIALYEASKKRS